MRMVSTIIIPGNHSGRFVSKLHNYLVPEGPTPLWDLTPVDHHKAHNMGYYQVLVIEYFLKTEVQIY